MPQEAETTIEWTSQIASIRQRYEAALRAGETIDGLDVWLRQVPEHVRPLLRKELQQCGGQQGGELGPASAPTLVLHSDAALGCNHEGDKLFSRDRYETVNVVEECKTFHGLSPSAQLALHQRLKLRAIPAGTKLLRQGEPASGLYLILSGSVDIVDTSNGERIDCDGAGSVLGEMSLLTDQPCSAEVLAVSDVEALVLSTDGYEELRAKHPELEIALSQLVSDRLGGRRHDALCGKTIGDYRFVRCINRGGMGVVYEAVREGDHDPVALKMLRHRFIYDNRMQSRFDQEADLLADLRHPNIVSFREHFLAYRTRFLVLDLCDGSDLFRIVRRQAPLSEPTARAILGQIASGLNYAHQQRVIHRDLKPGNVLVDRRGLVKLTDFGLSKLIESEVPDLNAVGTPSYMPPEQFGDVDVGPQCDWYAWGCIACELLTGGILFMGGSWTQMRDKKIDRFPTDKWPKLGNVSSELREIIHGALQPNAKERRLDLDRVSRWAENVEELFQGQASSGESQMSGLRP